MKIKHYMEEDILIVELEGELENKTVHRMKPFIMEVVTRDRKNIVLDMEKVKSVDFSWCSYMEKMYKVMKGFDRNLVIARCPECIADETYTKHVKSLYPLFATMEEALRHFNPAIQLEEKKETA